MAREQVQARLHWRDENYGSVSDAYALRLSFEPRLSDTAHLRMRRALKREGFAYNENRGSYIAEYALGNDAPVRVVEAFEGFGWSVTNHACVPDCLKAPEPNQAPERETAPPGP